MQASNPTTSAVSAGRRPRDDEIDEQRFPRALESAALRVHEDIQRNRPTGPLQAYMATTLTLWIGVWPRAYLLQVGDSRCYLLRNGELMQLSRDQTLAQDLIDRGVFRRSDTLSSPFSNVLSSALGGPEAAPIVTHMQQEWGNVGLLCSDGLTKHVPDNRIRERLLAMTSTPEGRTTLPCWWGGRCGRIQAEASGLSDLMAVPDLVILSTRVVTGEGIRPAAVAIADGVITAVHEHGGPPDAARQLDVGDAALLPGVVDTHVHVNEPGRTEWEGFETATRAAAAGGVTTIVDMPLNSVPVTTTVTALELKARAAAGHATVDYAFWGGVVPGNTGQLGPLARAGARGFKCFLVPSGIDEFPPVTERDLRPAMAKLAGLGLPLLVHAELPGPIARAAPSRGGDPRRYGSYLASRPRAAELEAVELMLDLCRETGCPVHIVHVSAADTLERLRRARDAGLRVTAETCPHYLTFAAEEILDGATAWKCAPPIRERSNRERLWEGLADGTLDLVASDHSPAPPELKCLDTGDFVRAWGGVASLELGLAATWTGARDRGRDLGDLARCAPNDPPGSRGSPAKDG